METSGQRSGVDEDLIKVCRFSQSPGAQIDGWNSWNQLRLLCDLNPRLQVCLEFTADLPETDQELNRWLGEPVRSVIIPTDAFLTNKQGFPADLIVSELLGSFADNELSPECLDGRERARRGWLRGW
eukprot:Skav211102  [mRNA]  locus=scaffold2002:510411:526705:- [translate_table: standard]